MDSIEKFKKEAHKFVDWIADYYATIEHYPVMANSKPGNVFSQIPDYPPDEPEEMNRIFEDFERIILPGITHWQSPGFFAYFPSNSSYPSMLAEMLSSALAVQCMKWETSPAATELEEAMMNWLKRITGLPEYFEGVLQDTASTATLCAILTAREKATGFMINDKGFGSLPTLRVYCSAEAHSSIEKAVKIAGIGRDNLIKIELDEEFRLVPELLENEIQKDIKKGFKPICVVAALGTTGSTAVDPLEEIAGICNRYDTWLHVDAAYAGSALILPEYRWMLKGIERVDSFVFNPHKWLFTNFDCSAYFVKDRESLIKTFRVMPEYLKSQVHDHVNDYSNWGIQLGRKFRALKLWFVLRSFGIKSLQERLRNHIKIANSLKSWIENDDRFELLAPVHFNLVCFRFLPPGINDLEALNNLNEKLLKELNHSGIMYLSHTKLNGKYCLRMVTGQTRVDYRHVKNSWNLIVEKAEILANQLKS
jgi:aromatic-L-amino-acid decarboxylase